MSYSKEHQTSQSGFQYNGHNFNNPVQYNHLMAHNTFNSFDNRQTAYIKGENSMYPPHQGQNMINASTNLSQQRQELPMSMSEQNNEFNMPRYIPHSFHNQQMMDQTHPQTPAPPTTFHTLPSHQNTQIQYREAAEAKYTSAGAGSPDNSMHYASSLRFQVILEAQTAAAQKSEDAPLTYLNKGQYYPINFYDREKYDGEITSTIVIMFYDEAHRRMAGTYWGFWLSQQPSPRGARALIMDKGGSNGAYDTNLKHFDRVTFTWNGQKGARILLRFNCLSTDFSRIKGVKGIPMKVHVTHRFSQKGAVIERSFAKIKLFRDKGAERKNKDDQRHLEKIWEKMKGKSMEDNPFIAMYSPVSQVTEFRECLYTNEVGESEKEYTFPPTEEEIEAQSQLQIGQMLENGMIKERRFDTLAGTEIPDLIDVDPTYIPHLRKPKPLLCIFVKLLNESVYRAIYLERLNVQELIDKLAAKLQLQPSAITGITRLTQKGIRIHVDDSMVAQMTDEMDMVVECSFTPDSGSAKMTLILNY